MQTSKRIAVISYHTCPLSHRKEKGIGGMNSYIIDLSKALAAKGFTIDIYTRCVEKNSPQVVRVTPNLRVIHLPAGECKEIPKKELFQHVPEFTENMLKFMSKEDLSYELIYAHYYLSGLIGLEIKNKYKIPLFVTFHTLALMKNLVAKNENEGELLQRIKSELTLVKFADKVIATSELDRQHIHMLYDCSWDKIALLSPGVDLKLFKPIDKLAAKKIIKAEENKKIILFVGRIEPLKGIDVLLYAIKMLIHKNPDLPFNLWIVGGNTSKKTWSKEHERLNEITKLLNLTAYVKFVGRKKRQDLPYYYNCAEVVLMPSQYESFGITALEAMACGVPVIITDVTGIAGLLDQKHNSLLTSAGNPIALAKKIKNLLINEKEHTNMSREVLKKVQDLSWEATADKFAQILSK